MSSMNECFSKRLEELIDEFPEHNLIFFKGFGIEQMRQLVTHANAILNDETLLQNEYLDINALDDKWLELASSIKCAKEPLVGFYEELLAIRQLLPRIKVDKIVIVENNLLSPWVPCYFPYHDAEMLFDYWQTEHEVSDENPLSQLVQLYGDVKLLKNQKALFLPLKLDDERIVEIPFWTGNIIEQEDIADNAEYIEVGSNRDWEYCLDITQGKVQAAVFLQNSETLSARTRATIYASKLLGFDVSIDELDLYQEKIEYSDSQFTGILQKYWGSAAHFRPLLFYKDPDRSQETETITQGQIIAEIVDQCEAAQNKEAYSNIFITAPTGSGKSILFQIHQIEQCVVNAPDSTFFRFYPLTPNKQIEIMPLLRFMELLGLATYEIRGGEKAEVFIRINDPEKIERLATSGRYTNGVLQNIQEHHRNNENLLTAFFTANMSDEERWEVIEQYFLGNGDYVRQVLHMSD